MDLPLDTSAELPGPLNNDAVWGAADLPSRPEWNHRLEHAERAELLSLLDLLEDADDATSPTVGGRPAVPSSPL